MIGIKECFLYIASGGFYNRHMDTVVQNIILDGVTAKDMECNWTLMYMFVYGQKGKKKYKWNNAAWEYANIWYDFEYGH